MNPFGYIPTTGLVGRGDTVNNPFLINGYTRLDMKEDGPPAIAGDKRPRNAFGNHMFCVAHEELGWRVADACAGPHHGKTIAAYLADAISSDDVFEKIPPFPGDEGNISYLSELKLK